MPLWWVEGIRVSATALFQASLTPSNADEFQLVVQALRGHDQFYLSEGSDAVSGFAGNDTIFGQGGEDYLRGENGNDYVAGGAGLDILFGGLGRDTLEGGADADLFVFDTLPRRNNVDVIADFVAGEDALWLDQTAFAGLTITGGTLAEQDFHIGSTAQDAWDRIIYDPTTGALLYDVDGSGRAKAVQFATLSPALALDASDIFVA